MIINNYLILKMSEVALARQYILGFIDALESVKSERYNDYDITWKHIDQLDDEPERHRRTIAYYESIAFK